MTDQIIFIMVQSYLLATLFSAIKKPETAATDLNNDFKELNSLAFQWIITFNSDPSKQAQEVLSRRKITKTIHP